MDAAHKSHRGPRKYAYNREGARDREMHLYLPYWGFSDSEKHAQQSIGAHPNVSRDNVLTVFAQLAALRMHAKRALVSLFDREYQHIVAEANPDLRLRTTQGSGETKHLWLGVRKLPRHEISMCANAMKSFMDDEQEIFIANDLTKDERFRDHFSVTGHPHNRFYVSVPIQSPDGYVIGSVAVLDDQPRDGVSPEQKQFLQDLSATVMDHLLSQRAMREEYREEKMVRALGLFVRGKSDLKEWFHSRDPPEKKYGQHIAHVNQKLEQLQVSGEGGDEEENEVQAQQEKSDPPNLAPPKHKTSHVSPIQKFNGEEDTEEDGDTENEEAQEDSKPGKKRPRLSPTTSHLQDAIAPSNVRQVLNRASSLIYQALDLEGAMFIDASVYARRQAVGPTESENASHPEAYSIQNQADGDRGQVMSPADSNQSSSSGKNAEQSQSKSLVLGHYTSFSSKTSKEKLTDRHYVSLPGDFVSHLIDQYPRGKIFHIEEDGSIALSYEGLADEMHYAPDGGRGARTMEAHKKDIQQETMDIKQLTKILPDARCIAIYPVWDFQRSRWFTVSLVWSNDPGRVLSEPKDLTYMAAFSNSVMAEVSRLDLEAADRAKGDFISSISHELRSPLHGLLGTVELLQESAQGYAQRSLIETVYSCGRTLLDTLNHLLDYAKINTLTRSRGSEKGSLEVQKAQAGNLQEEDLGVLVQEVVEGLLAGAEYQGRGTNSDGNTKNADDDSNGGLTTIVDIEWQDNWHYKIYAGAWRRVVMNLFGNAMKYTRSGFVRLLMKKSTLVIDGNTHPAIHLTVSDSGRGMSQDFLTHHLYSAFLQEDNTSPGLGVGLHLVNEIVKSLKGQIKFTSEVSRGTDVDVIMPVSRADSSIPPSPHASLKERLGGMTVSLFTKTAHRKNISNNLNISDTMLSSLGHMVTNWFGLQVLTLDQLNRLDRDERQVDFMIITEHEYRNLYRRDSNGLVLKNPDEPQPLFPLIVLSARTNNWRSFDDMADEAVIFLMQPVSPKSLATAFEHCLDLRNSSGRFSPRQLSQSKPCKPSNIPVTELLDGESEVGENGVSVNQGQSGGKEMGQPSSTEQQDGQVGQEGLKTLLVEDNPINLRILETCVKSARLNYQTATNGLEALKSFKAGRRDVVVMDISMPVMDGLTAAREMRRFEKSSGQKPATIIILTAVVSASLQQEAMMSGVNLFLTKPTPIKKLKDILRRLSNGEDVSEL
ncbi:hypothetical protein BBP40_004311 [Aspergillus hancockii]|nr:hypothetical protein BBP40_004311 [Aspergillus hancockii]